MPTPEAFYNATRDFNPHTLAYEASPGRPDLIEAIRNYYAKLGISLDTSDIFITTGGSEALLFTCLSILDPYTAVSYGSLQDYRAKTGESCPTVLLWDRNPMHYLSIVEKATGLTKREIENTINQL